MPLKKIKLRYYHLFCIDCVRGWHFVSIEDVLLMERIHIKHRRYSNPVPITCGPECANEWEMLKNADV